MIIPRRGMFAQTADCGAAVAVWGHLGFWGASSATEWSMPRQQICYKVGGVTNVSTEKQRFTIRVSASRLEKRSLHPRGSKTGLGAIPTMRPVPHRRQSTKYVVAVNPMAYKPPSRVELLQSTLDLPMLRTLLAGPLTATRLPSTYNAPQKTCSSRDRFPVPSPPSFGGEGLDHRFLGVVRQRQDSSWAARWVCFLPTSSMRAPPSFGIETLPRAESIALMIACSDSRFSWQC